MKIVFMGTPDFSASVLEKLNSVYPVAAVVTGLDKISGRGHKMNFCALKTKALELDIPVLQYEKVSKQGIAEIKALEPDIVVTAAFGQILSDEFLSIPKYGVLNVHASLLPKYRGSSPIQQAVLDGEKVTGITIMKTVKEVDAGDVLLQKQTEIGENETAGELFDRLSALGGEAIVEAVKLIEENKAVFVPQDNSRATHCKMLSKADGETDFSKSARELDFFVRGMTPWPSAYTEINGKTLKILKLEKSEYKSNGICGEVVAANPQNGLIVACGDGAVRLTRIQAENGKPMTDVEFLRGHNIPVGAVLPDNSNE